VVSSSVLCTCGCGQTVGQGALYRPGHDARHASQVGRALIAAGTPDPALLAELPSEALRGKAAAMLDRAAVSSARAKVEVETEPLAALPAGDSLEQREAEAVLLASLSALLGCDLAPSRVHLPDGAWVEVDGLCKDPPVLAEVWAHQGQTKPAQRNKVLADALKLLHVAAQLPVPHRKVLCLSDEQAARPFLGRSWYAGALRSLAIEVLVVPLDDATRERVAAAQRRQYR
jgi:hypothetical protein